ncbi:MAG TPA: pitrilysin family protein [Bacteroidales bacterium]|nr:pitrilysin family protein [Bacteroidales bacterium]
MPRKKTPSSAKTISTSAVRQSYEHTVLPNGLRIVHRRAGGEVAHLALMIGAGTRHEGSKPEGIAHLTEHMLFKGTKKRKAHQVVNFLENVGCDLNAYTTREETCIHASFLHPYYSRAIELFADVACSSTFPEQELEKEKTVALDEINSYKDSPAEEIFDTFEYEFFRPHSLGRYILGRPETLPGITRNDMLEYVRMNFAFDRMVLVSIGNISFRQLQQFALRHFGVFQGDSPAYSHEHFEANNTFHTKVPTESHLSHCIIGMPGYHYSHPDKLPLILLNNILGGPALHARLNQNIREKYGIAYSIDSQLAHYADAGWLTIYLGTEPGQMDKAIALAIKEMKKLREQALGSLQLARAKQQLIVQLAISRESGLNEALSVGKAWLIKNHASSMAEIMGKVEEITPSVLLNVANEIFDEQKMSTLIYQAENQ